MLNSYKTSRKASIKTCRFTSCVLDVRSPVLESTLSRYIESSRTLRSRAQTWNAAEDLFEEPGSWTRKGEVMRYSLNDTLKRTSNLYIKKYKIHVA